VPAIGNMQKFARQWRCWWQAMQPAWRVSGGNQTWPLPREEHNDEQWTALRRGGKNGFVLVMLCLLWWTK
ncbi:hypothetical protein FA95DRAFT_1479393, partial [Auriscalpium vulgare]